MSNITDKLEKKISGYFKSYMFWMILSFAEVIGYLTVIYTTPTDRVISGLLILVMVFSYIMWIRYYNKYNDSVETVNKIIKTLNKKK